MLLPLVKGQRFLFDCSQVAFAACQPLGRDLDCCAHLLLQVDVAELDRLGEKFETVKHRVPTRWAGCSNGGLGLRFLGV